MSEIVINKLFISNFFKNIHLKKQYINKLKHKILNIKNLTKQTLHPKSSLHSSISYVVYIIQKRTDTVLHITDSLGNLIYSFNASSVGFHGKAKRKARSSILKKFIKILIKSKKLSFLVNQPIALHIKNVSYIKRWFIKCLREKFRIEIIRFFYSTPFNGCRGKKIRRKKVRKKNRRSGRVV